MGGGSLDQRAPIPTVVEAHVIGGGEGDNELTRLLHHVADIEAGPVELLQRDHAQLVAQELRTRVRLCSE